MNSTASEIHHHHYVTYYSATMRTVTILFVTGICFMGLFILYALFDKWIKKILSTCCKGIKCCCEYSITFICDTVRLAIFGLPTEVTVAEEFSSYIPGPPVDEPFSSYIPEPSNDETTSECCAGQGDPPPYTASPVTSTMV